MEHRLWRKKSNCIQTNEIPSLKEEGETVAKLVLLEMSRDYKSKGKKLYIITVLKLIKLYSTIIWISNHDAPIGVYWNGTVK